MSYQLNKKIRELVPYEPISGTYKVRLDANECPFDYTDEIREKLNKALESVAFNRYPDPLAEDVINSFSEYYDLNPKNVMAGNGSDELIFLIESAFMQKGDKMLVVSPDFSMYGFYSSICETVCETFYKDEELNIDVDALINKINSDNIDMVIFSNPCNPTGRGITVEEAKRLISSVEALIVLDEAYMDFWNQTLIREAKDYSNLIILRTASKAFGSAALRLGFAVAQERLINVLKSVKSPYNVNSISQAFGTVIYKCKEYISARQKIIVNNRKKLYNELSKLAADQDDFKVYESCANFVLIKTSAGKEIWNYLKENSIVIRYMGDYIRISAGTEEEVSEVIKYLNEYFSR